MRFLYPATIALLCTFSPARTHAQWCNHHPMYGMHPGWSMQPSQTWMRPPISIPPYGFTPAPPSFIYQRPWMSPPPMWMQQPMMPIAPYWNPQMNYVIPPAPAIPASTYRVDPLVTSCRWLQLNNESCLWSKTLAPDSLATDTGILLSIANAMRWGTGYAVVARFTEHADHTLEVLVNATPIYPGYIPQSVTGRATTSVMAMEAALTNVGTQTVR